MKSLHTEFKKPWAERDLAFIAEHQQAAIAYHGLPPLPEGAVLGGPGVDGSGKRLFPWACRRDKREWLSHPCPDGYKGNCESYFYAYEAANPPFRKDPPEQCDWRGMACEKGEGCILEKGHAGPHKFKEVRKDPDPATWPAPPEGCKWEVAGWGAEGPFRPGDCCWQSALKIWLGPGPAALLQGGRSHCFYLEAVPLPKEPVPLDCPADLLCDPRWIRRKGGPVIRGVKAIGPEGLAVGIIGHLEWMVLDEESWFYTNDTVEGVWHPFTKPAPGKETP